MQGLKVTLFQKSIHVLLPVLIFFFFFSLPSSHLFPHCNFQVCSSHHFFFFHFFRFTHATIKTGELEFRRPWVFSDGANLEFRLVLGFELQSILSFGVPIFIFCWFWVLVYLSHQSLVVGFWLWCLVLSLDGMGGVRAQVGGEMEGLDLLNFQFK